MSAFVNITTKFHTAFRPEQEGKTCSADLSRLQTLKVIIYSVLTGKQISKKLKNKD